jgi:two-component system, response regulator PdtaR
MKMLRVLVVEDEAIIAMLLVELLRQMGHEICGVEVDEASAVTAAVRDEPDLMIVDAKLHEGNGLAVVQAVLAHSPVPHVFISGDVPSILAAHPSAVVIQKPFHERELVQAIERALEPVPPV